MMKRREWVEYLDELDEEIAKTESRLAALKQEKFDHMNEPYYDECVECGCEVSPDNRDCLCYQCQCELHAIGAFDMDGKGWV